MLFTNPEKVLPKSFYPEKIHQKISSPPKAQIIYLNNEVQSKHQELSLIITFCGTKFST